MSRRAGTPVRVCMVAPSLDILGGQAVQAARLLDRLGEVRSVAVRFVPVNPRLPGALRLLQRVRYVRTLVTWPWYLATLLRELPRCDVVHAFSASYLSFLLAPAPAIVLGRLLGRRVLLNYRSGEAEDHLARSPLARRLMRLAHEIVVPSGYLVAVFARFGLRARAIANFVEGELPRSRALDAARPVLLANRNLEPLYNVDCVLRAFALVQRRVPGARLVVAGDGSRRAALERLAAELGLRDVAFLGRVAPQEMPRLYAEADVYVNAPDIDNMPNSVLEAFAAGVPVATTDAGGIPYVVTHGVTGLLVPRGDHEALAAAALRLIEEPGLAGRLAAAARGECERRYRWPSVAPEWESLYLGDAPPARRARPRAERTRAGATARDAAGAVEAR